ncbi:MAG: hypothetical protein FVQ80_13900 [Planctomycetes bacterium]|nr:hypothetical protein [Planctomycetota bacterium]
MKDILSDIRTKIKNGCYKNEEHVRLSLVARILQKLGWNLSLILAKKLKSEIKVEFCWRVKDGAAYPCQEGILSWKP